MKVLALNSSPRAEGQSKTNLMLTSLVEGMQDAGAEVEAIELRRKTIKNCIGCYTCWTKTPGKCIHKDDMTDELFPKWLASDMVVYATPLYNYSMNATLKAFVERTLPSMEPFLEFQNNRMYHPLRFKAPGVVMLSVAGMPDDGHFKALSILMNYSTATPGRRLIAEIYRPAAEMLTNPALKDKRREVLDATFQAGRELVRSQQISPATMARVTQPLLDSQSFAHLANAFWKTCITEGVTPKEFAKKNLRPRPDTMEAFRLMMPLGFNPDSAKGLRATLQFEFTGEVEGNCHFVIADDAITAKAGRAAKPDLTITSPFEVWMDIMTGKADGAQMLMEGEYTAEGNMDLLLNMSKIFGQS
jgi:multimeric flavodoxin WrbA/putative sterol carrier protein